MPRSKARTRRSVGRPSRYDWEVILNGTPRVMRPGVDFDVSVVSFRAQLYAAAAKYERSVSTKVRSDGSLWLQGAKPHARFDFGALFDGAEHVLFRETHFVGDLEVFAAAVRRAARAAKTTVGVQIEHANRAVVVRPAPVKHASRAVDKSKLEPVAPPTEPWRPKRPQLDEHPPANQEGCTCPWRRAKRVGVDRGCSRHGLPSVTITDQS